MDNQLKEKLKYLRLKYLESSWQEVCDNAQKRKISYHKFLSDVIEKEYFSKAERGRQARMKAAKLPELFLMENYPFTKQPKLKKQLIMECYDSLTYIRQNKSVCFIGPTGVGKTGLSAALLIHAIDNGYKGRYITFNELMEELLQSGADFTSKNTVSKLALLDCLLIDDIGVGKLSPHFQTQSGIFFDLMNKRNKRKCTIISTQLGFDEWEAYFKDEHLTAALIDRLTENCILFNMKRCKSIRPKNIQHGIRK